MGFIVIWSLRKFYFPIILLWDEHLKEKKSAFYLDFEKRARLALKIAILSKSAIFAIIKKQSIWYKNIELVKANCKIWYDLENWFQCLLNFFSVSRHHWHTVFYELDSVIFRKLTVLVILMCKWHCVVDEVVVYQFYIEGFCLFC